ncbi:hypothetical protein E2C01_033932 [Portunus trituberculatus]|uniref:Uncharacterized protein n=1 Tax=Portunus trituberculatus TaxID=210409 RepID=A0A5B7F433_PORTR|nr:hypothetical protein [Portunus trituberculatus]
MFSHSCQCHCREAPACSGTSTASLARSPMAPRMATEESSRAKGTTCLKSRRGRNRRGRNRRKVSGTNSMTSLSPDGTSCGSQAMSNLGYKGPLRGLKLPLLHSCQSLTIKKVGANRGRHQLPSLPVTIGNNPVVPCEPLEPRENEAAPREWGQAMKSLRCAQLQSEEWKQEKKAWGDPRTLSLREWCCMKSCFSATNKVQEGDWHGGSWLPTNPEALPEKGAGRRLNPVIPGPATEETGSVGTCKPLDPEATPGSGIAHKLIPPRPENSLEALETVEVYTTLASGATHRSGVH